MKMNSTNSYTEINLPTEFGCNDNKKTLPINPTPPINCYSSHANALAIITNSQHFMDYDAIFVKTKIIGQCIDNVKHYRVFNIGCESKVIYNIESINVRVDKTESKKDVECFCFIYKAIEGDATIITKVDYQKHLHKWYNVGIMITSQLEEKLRGARIVVTPERGINTYFRDDNNSDYIVSKYCDTYYPAWLKLEITGNIVRTYSSVDSREWVLNKEVKMTFSKHVYMGLFISACEKNIEDWYYSNYIQIHCSKKLNNDGDVPIDFFTGIRRDSFYYLNNPWLFTQNINKNLLSKTTDIINFIINCNNIGCYVILMLDEFFVSNTKSYRNRHVDHCNMIYGYDLYNKMFYLIGYDFNSIFKPFYISFNELVSAYHNSPSTESVYVVNFTCPDAGYTFNLDVVVEFLREYLYSLNSFNRFSFLNNPLDRVFGISVYKALIENMDSILMDIRPLHLLWEHKKCMKERITFLYRKNIFNKAQYDYFYNEFEVIERNTLINRNKQIKYTITKNNNLLKSIKNTLIYIENKERILIEELLNNIAVYCKTEMGG